MAFDCCGFTKISVEDSVGRSRDRCMSLALLHMEFSPVAVKMHHFVEPNLNCECDSYFGVSFQFVVSE
jgi:hypothetical protein